jgi:hypothetical protein
LPNPFLSVYENGCKFQNLSFFKENKMRDRRRAQNDVIYAGMTYGKSSFRKRVPFRDSLPVAVDVVLSMRM